MIPVEGYKGLYRDQDTNAIINCNYNDYDEYVNLKNSILNEKSEIQNLKNELSEIKFLLSQLLQNKI